MKYIIVERCGLKFPVLFPDLLTHSQVAEGFKPPDAKVVSAGFCECHFRLLGPGRAFNVSGHSESLGLSCHAEDHILIEDFIYLGDATLINNQSPDFVSSRSSRSSREALP